MQQNNNNNINNKHHTKLNFAAQEILIEWISMYTFKTECDQALILTYVRRTNLSQTVLSKMLKRYS